jgi:hypothetical protein
MSSSTDKSIAHFFAKKHEKKRAPGFFGALKEPIKDHSPKHIFHWHHEKDQPIGVVGKHSFYPAEKEVLIPRTESTPEKYHIEHLGTDKYTSHNGVEYNVHHVRRIPESEIIKNA